MLDTQKFFRYLIECVEHEIDSNVWCEYPDDPRKEPHWTFMSEIPFIGDGKVSTGFLSQPEINDVIKLGQDKSLATSRYVFGYPVVKANVIGKGGKKKAILYPVYYWRVVDVRTGDVVGPYINSKFVSWVLRSSSDYKCFLKMIQAEGFNLTFERKDLQTLAKVIDHFVKLTTIWKGEGELDLYHLSTLDIPSSAHTGVYNRAMFAAASSIQYTKSLLEELKALSQKKPEDFRGTALEIFWEKLFEGKSPSKEAAYTKPIVETKAVMNQPQWLAVKEALGAKLTVIQGPPGTGKTQVVKNLYKNALLAGQTVLFSSRNHEAIRAVVGENNDALDMLNLSQTKTEDYKEKTTGQFLADLYRQRVETIEQYLKKHPKNPIKLNSLWKSLQDYENRRNEVLKEESAIRQQLTLLHQHADARDAFLTAFPEATDKKIPLYDTMKCLCRDLVAEIDDFHQYKHKQTDGWKLLFRPLGLYLRRRHVAALLEKAIHYFGNEQLELPGVEFWEDNPLRAQEVLREVLWHLNNLADYEAYNKAIKKLDQLPDLAWVHQELYRNDKARQDVSGKIADFEMQTVFAPRFTKEKLSAFRAVAEKASKRAECFWEVGSKLQNLLPAVALTTLSADKRLPLEAGRFDLLIIDEAGQVDPISVVPLLFRAKRVAVIGDPKQLSPIISVQKAIFDQLDEKYEGMASCWPYVGNSSFFDIAKVVNDNKVNLLSYHYRCDPAISGFSSHHYYGDDLINAGQFEKEKRPYPDKLGIILYDVENSESLEPNKCVEEAGKVLSLVSDLINNRFLKPSDIGVICPFRNQKDYLKTLLKKYEERGLKVDTAHGFQGGEKDVVIYSACVSQSMSAGSKSFLETSDNLFNVAITRAKKQLLVVLDRNAVYQSGLNRLCAFIEYVDHLSLDDSENSKNESDPRMSEIEKVFAKALDELGVKYVQQEPVGSYFLDFGIHVGDRKLDLEIDGEAYHMSASGGQRFYDRQRDEYMFDHGWDVKRYWATAVMTDPYKKAKEISDWVQKAIKLQAVQSQKEGRSFN